MFEIKIGWYLVGIISSRLKILFLVFLPVTVFACNSYYESGELEQAQFYCEKAINLLKKMKQLSFLSELLHMEVKIKDKKKKLAARKIYVLYV